MTTVPVVDTSIYDLLTWTLSTLDTDPRSCIVLGAPATNGGGTVPRKGGFEPAPLSWLPLDFDTAVPATTEELIASMPPPLCVGSILQRTASHRPDAPRYRLWYHLSAPIGYADAARIAASVGADTGIYQAGRLIFTAAPGGHYAPAITEPRFELLDHWLFTADEVDVDALLAELPPADALPDLPGPPAVRGELTAEQLAELLAKLPVDEYSRDHYTEWLQVMAASYHVTGGTDEAFEAFDLWSDGDPGYRGLREARREKWETLARESGSRLGFHHLATEVERHGGKVPDTARPVVPLLTDAGNAHRFASYIFGRARYCPPFNAWLLWDGSRWRVDTEGHIVELAKRCVRSWLAESYALPDEAGEALRKHAVKSEAAAKLRAMIDLAKSEHGIPVLPAELDAEPLRLTCSNGIVDLATGELHPATPESTSTKTTNTAWEPAAFSRLWDDCLNRWTAGNADLRAYLQRVAGYALLGEWREKSFWFLFGKPNGGKSAFLSALCEALGEYAQSADSSTWLARRDTGGNRGDLVRLRGARLVVTSEFRKDSRFDESILKSVTGGDTITAAAKYQHEISFRSNFTLILAANDAPKIRDDDAGLWDRVRRVPFTVEIPEAERDKQLAEKLKAPEVRSAILAWAAQGLRAYLAAGIGACAAVSASSADYRQEMDRLAGFIEDEAVIDLTGGNLVAQPAFHARYLHWCERYRIKPLTRRDLASRLEAWGVTEKKTRTTRYWVGVSLRSEGEGSEGYGFAEFTGYN
ncbi:MAG TPA: phage/plasmid primase, P4 family [Candidatus Paceibacterota bacterium]|nr:phage/plasmid primase, P4 family [Candidatus Paceibacterota bacterium]